MILLAFMIFVIPTAAVFMITFTLVNLFFDKILKGKIGGAIKAICTWLISIIAAVALIAIWLGIYNAIW